MVTSRNDPPAVPNTRRAPSTSLRPHAWPMRMVEAMPKPNTKAVSRNITMLALEVAASASSPMKRPTQIALMVPFSDWMIEDASVGSAKASRVLEIGPCVRSPRPAFRSCVRHRSSPVTPAKTRVHARLQPRLLDMDASLRWHDEERYPSRSNAARSRSASAAFASWSARAFSTASGLARSVKLGLARRAARLSRSFSAASAAFDRRAFSASRSICSASGKASFSADNNLRGTGEGAMAAVRAGPSLASRASVAACALSWSTGAAIADTRLERGAPRNVQFGPHRASFGQ